MVVVNITDIGSQLEVTFETGKTMYVSKNSNNALRQKLEQDYPELYPADETES